MGLASLPYSVLHLVQLQCQHILLRNMVSRALTLVPYTKVPSTEVIDPEMLKAEMASVPHSFPKGKLFCRKRSQSLARRGSCK